MSVVCVEVLGFQAGGLITSARLIHGCALDPDSVDGIPGHAQASATNHSTPLMLSPGTPGDAQTEGSLGQ